MAEDWRLRDEQGNVRSLSALELRDGLSSGTIPSSAQVARPGSEFKPAFSVPELATAAIRAERTPSIPPGVLGSGARAATPAPPRAATGKLVPPIEVPAPPRSRRRIAHTLVGIQGDEDESPPGQGAPIVAPGAQGSGGGAPRAITQVPRYTPAPPGTSPAPAEVVIPRAPRAPGSLTLTATDQGWEEADTASSASSIFDDEETQSHIDKRSGRPDGPPRSHPPPLPARKDGARPSERPLRKTDMGMGSVGLGGRTRPAAPGLAPRLIPPRQASTPPPPVVAAAKAGPVSAGPVSAGPVSAGPTSAGPTSAGPTSGPASRPPPPVPPKRTPAPPQVRPPVPSSSKTPAPTAVAPTSVASSPTAPAVEPSPARLPATKEGPPALAKHAEGTPTVPMPEARESISDVDEAPTGKMAVQIVHGAAMAMRAALAAPHPAEPTASGAASAGAASSGAAATPAPTEVASAALPAVRTETSEAAQQSGASASAAPSGAPETAGSEPARIAEALPLPPATGVTLQGIGSSSSAPPSRSTSSAPPEDSDEVEDAPQSGVEVPVSSLFAASAVWIVGLVLVFFVGRCSALETRAEAARRGVAATSRLAFLAVMPTPAAGGGGEPKPCWVTRQPNRWAARASKNVPFEMVAVPGGSAMLVGYAESDEVGVGARIDPRTGKLQELHRAEQPGGLERLTPLPGADAQAAPTFFASLANTPSVLAVPGLIPPYFVRFSAEGLSVLATPDAEGERVHPLEGDGKTNAEQLTLGGEQGVFASFRRGNAVHGAWMGADRKARGEVKTIAGSGGTVGKPRASWNGAQIAVVFADKPEGGRWEARLGRAGGGEVPLTTEVFAIPTGGPGGDVIAPDIVGLPDGRWLVMWTEGAAGSRAIRSITLAPDLTPIGDPIALSPPAGNFGQAQLGVVGGYVTVLFLQKGDEDFELWGAVLQCG